ncbi:MAG: hypothetical protein ACFFB0_15030 [Promethearchaeota archaeon]
MVKENLNSNIESNIESELYALIHTILNAYEKFKEGVINNIYFRKTVKNAINELLKFNFILDEKKIELSTLLKKMNFTKQYYKAIGIINKLSSLEFSKNLSETGISDQLPISNEISSIVLELPGITLEITSSFITLMDALKLNGFKERELIEELFRELINNMERFPGIDTLLLKVKAIFNQSFNNKTNFDDLTKSKEIIVDEIYQLFKEFQNKLNPKQ